MFNYNSSGGVFMPERIFDMLGAAKLDIFGVTVICDGEVILHKAFGEDIRRPVYSATKSVTSAAFCLACDDGLISADSLLCEFLEKRYASLMSQSFKSLPLRRFLTMTAGEYPFRPYGDNWLETALTLDTDHSDMSFHYSNIPAYLVGVAVENSVGEPLMRYLEKRLFSPLGISAPPFQTSPEGHFYGATGMELTPLELARFGQLWLDSGSLNGKQLISQASVMQTVKPYVKTGSGDSYGYFFRVADDHYSIVGKWGQRCMVYPEKRLVIAYLSHQPERSDELASVFNTYAGGFIPPNKAL